MVSYDHERLDRIAKAGQKFFMQNCAESTACASAKDLSGHVQETELLSGTELSNSNEVQVGAVWFAPLNSGPKHGETELSRAD
jgi:hypothetical protein